MIVSWAPEDGWQRWRLERELERVRASLVDMQPESYRRDLDFRRVLTNRLNRISRLEMLLREE